MNPAEVHEEPIDLEGGTDNKGRIRLATLLAIRWIALTGQITSLLIVALVLKYEMDTVLLFTIVLIGAFLNGWLQLTQDRNATLTWAQTTLHLIFDVLHLALLLFLTGGIVNPFAVLLLAPPVFAATILPARYSYWLGGLVVICLTVLLMTPWPVPWEGEPFQVPVILKAGVWVALAITLGFTVLFVTRIATESSNRNKALAATQLALAKEQELASLGTLAAAAAHELGTPLGTITLASNEMLGHDGVPDDLIADVEIIAQEAVRCRSILSKISQARRGAFEDPFAEQQLEAIVREAAAPHEARGRVIDFKPFGAGQPVMSRKPELIHGLRNILENAVGFARQAVTISFSEDQSGYRLRIEDDGPGFDPGIIKRLGEPYVTTRRPEAGRDGGMGLGLFIARTLLESTGASLSFGRATSGGARVDIVWQDTTELPAQDLSGTEVEL